MEAQEDCHCLCHTYYAAFEAACPCPVHRIAPSYTLTSQRTPSNPDSEAHPDAFPYEDDDPWD
jgi:hypothetical protein